MTEPRDIEVLEALFVGDDVKAADMVRAAHAGQQDAEVRALFDKLALADREVGGDFEGRFGEAWFLDSLDSMLAEEAADAEAVAEVVVLDDRRWSKNQMWLAAAAVVAVGFAAVALDQARTPEPEFQARSTATPKPTTYEKPSMEVFCVERDGDNVRFVGAEQSELATVRCAQDQEIKLAVRNPDPRLRFGAFFGISAEQSLYWYGPSPAAPRAFDMPNTTKLAPVGETIRLDVNHAPGTVRVVALFVEEPMSWSELEKWASANLGPLRDADVEVPHGVVIRQTFEVTQ